MKNVITIAVNDIYMFLKEPVGYVWLFVMPLLFTYFFGMAMQQSNRTPANPRPSLLIENEDSGYLGRLLMKEMDAQGMRLVEADEEQTPSRGIRIPADFTQKIESKEAVEITFFRIAESPLDAAAMIELRLTRAIIGMTSGLFALATGDGQELTEAALTDKLDRADTVQLAVSFAGRRPVPSGFQQSVPGYMVMFTLMNLLMYGGISIAGERTSGVLRRIAVHPITRFQVITGKITGRFLLGIVQLAFYFLAGVALFRVDFGGNIGLVVVTLAVFAWLCAALGVFIGAVIEQSERVQGLCLFAAW